MNLDEIKARCEAATEGPWYALGRVSDLGFLCADDGCFIDTGDGDSVVWQGEDGIMATEDDGKFIAHARVDVPALIQAVELLVRIAGPRSVLIETGEAYIDQDNWAAVSADDIAVLRALGLLQNKAVGVHAEPGQVAWTVSGPGVIQDDGFVQLVNPVHEAWGQPPRVIAHDLAEVLVLARPYNPDLVGSVTRAGIEFKVAFSGDHECRFSTDNGATWQSFRIYQPPGEDPVPFDDPYMACTAEPGDGEL